MTDQQAIACPAAEVYGGCIEPDDFELDDIFETAPCPKCNQPADHWHCERVEDGTINRYVGHRCEACGHHEGEQPADQDW